ncbi:hypothetical protein J7J90_03540 [Candidatus Micrarchaeota archaeon]|nr:hypothetical protein [Candidatus Micrarchaeota archaeon]
MFNDWMLLVVISMMTGLIVSVLLYLLAKFFKSSELEFKAKGFLADVFSTVLIVIILISFIEILAVGGRVLTISHMIESGTVIKELDFDIEDYAHDSGLGVTVGTWPDSATVFGYVEGTVIPNAEANNPKYSKLYNISSVNSYSVLLVKDTVHTMANMYKVFNTVYYPIKVASETSIVKNSGKPKGFFSGRIGLPLLTFTEFIMDKIDTIIFTQYLFMELMLYGPCIASFLLPLGIVLRMFPNTRGAGAMLVAFGLGLGFVIHTIYVYVFVIMEGIYPSNLLNAFYKNIEKSGSYQQVVRLMTEITEDCRIDKDDISLIMGQYGSLFKLFKTVISYITTNMFVVWIYRTLIYPVVALTGLYTFIRSAGLLLGADLTEIARGLAKVI